MKTFRYFLMMFLTVAVCAGFQSCSDDDSEGGLNGWYVGYLPEKGSSDWGGRAYHFVNSNTVEYFPTISGAEYWGSASQELPSPLDGYYMQGWNVQTYTYERIDNKVYIPKQGTIMTISGTDLICDGGSRYTKL